MTRLLNDLLQSSAPASKSAGRECTIHGGTDYMPRLLQHFSEQQQTRVLVSQSGASVSEVDGVVCGHKRGSAYFLFGLRVAEEARGKGRARALMEAICQRSEEFGPVQTVISATIPQQTAAIRIFNSMGFQHTHTVDQWPSWDAVAQYEQAIGWSGTGAPPEPEVLQQQPHMVDVLGMRDTLSQLASSTDVQLCDWMQCSSLEQLQQAMSSIRVQQQEHIQQVPSVQPLSYLPWVYEAYPLDACWTKQRLVEGQIWLLPSKQLQDSDSVSSNINNHSHDGSLASNNSSSGMASDSDGTVVGVSQTEIEGDGQGLQQYAAVVVVDFSLEARRYCAGVMTAEDAYIAPAVEFVASRLPHFVCFCDRGSRHSSGKPDPDVVLPAVITSTGPPSCFVVYARDNGQHQPCDMR